MLYLKESIEKLDRSKADIDSTNNALTQKADAILVEKHLNSKAQKNDLELMRDQMDKIYAQYVDKDVLNININQINSITDGLSKEISERSKIKDVCKLLDLKASIKYVDSKLSQQSTEINYKMRKDE